jgi:hypothetical protein
VERAVSKDNFAFLDNGYTIVNVFNDASVVDITLAYLYFFRFFEVIGECHHFSWNRVNLGGTQSGLAKREQSTDSDSGTESAESLKL